MTHWSKQYLGRQYIKGEQDCWTVFCDIQNNVFNKNLSELDFGNINERNARKEFINNPLRQRFKRVNIPIDGCAVFLSKGQYTSHIGTYIASGEGKVIHAVEHLGTIIQNISDLELNGWNIVGFYKIGNN